MDFASGSFSLHKTPHNVKLSAILNQGVSRDLENLRFKMATIAGQFILLVFP